MLDYNILRRFSVILGSIYLKKYIYVKKLFIQLYKEFGKMGLCSAIIS